MRPGLPSPQRRGGPGSRRHSPQPPPLACPLLAAAEALPPSPTTGDPAWSRGSPEQEVRAAAAGGGGGADRVRLGEGDALDTRFFVSPSQCAGSRSCSSRQVPASLGLARGPGRTLHPHPIWSLWQPPVPEAGSLGVGAWILDPEGEQRQEGGEVGWGRQGLVEGGQASTHNSQEIRSPKYERIHPKSQRVSGRTKRKL